MPTALIQIHTPNHRACSSWSTLSGSAVTQIVVTSSGTASEQEAKTLYDALLREVQQAGAYPEPTQCGGNFGPGPQGCWAANHPGAVRRVWIWVADVAVRAPTVAPHPGAYHVVLPLLPQGASVQNLPAGIAANLVCRYQPNTIVVDALPEVLVQSGLALDGFRIFISYRHDDCATAAEQLFDALICAIRFGLSI
jgi:hypothetical protein